MSALIATVASSVQIAQGLFQSHDGRRHHNVGLETAKKQHAEDLDQSRKHHLQDIENARTISRRDMDRIMVQQKREHLMSTYSNLESHFVQLDADLVNALKESERDMYDQRNQQLNTLILSSTVMLAALTTLLIEGNLPAKADVFTVILFSAACGISFALQTVCVVLCIETLRLASSYMIERARALHEQLKEGRASTRETFNDLRAGTENIPNYKDGRGMGMSAGRESVGMDKPKGMASDTHQYLVDADEHAFDPEHIEEDEVVDYNEDRKKVIEKWRGIERKHHSIMKERYMVNDKFALESASFEMFWNKHCKRHSDNAGKLFYGGSMFMLIGTVFWAWINFTILFSSNLAAIACIVPVVISVPVGMMIKKMMSEEYNEAKSKLKQTIEDGNVNAFPDVCFPADDEGINAYSYAKRKDEENVEVLADDDVVINKHFSNNDHDAVKTLNPHVPQHTHQYGEGTPNSNSSPTANRRRPFFIEAEVGDTQRRCSPSGLSNQGANSIAQLGVLGVSVNANHNHQINSNGSRNKSTHPFAAKRNLQLDINAPEDVPASTATSSRGGYHAGGAGIAMTTIPERSGSKMGDSVVGTSAKMNGEDFDRLGKMV